MIIRRVLKEDLESIYLLDQHELSSNWTLSTYEDYVDSPNALFFIAIESSTKCGFILYNLGLDQSDILQIAVNKTIQKNGIGTLLLEESLKFFSNGHEILLEVRESNKKAVSFYRKMGFEFVSIRKCYYDDGEDAHVYRKVI